VSLFDALVAVPLALGTAVWPIWQALSPETFDGKIVSICLLSGLVLSLFVYFFRDFRKKKQQEKMQAALLADWKRQQRRLRAFEDANQVMSGHIGALEGTRNKKLILLINTYVYLMNNVQEVSDEKHKNN
jgi:hypothetical protein